MKQVVWLSFTGGWNGCDVNEAGWLAGWVPGEVVGQSG